MSSTLDADPSPGGPADLTGDLTGDLTDDEDVPRRSGRSRLVVAVSVAVVLAVGALVVVLAKSPPANNRKIYSPLLGKPAPGIQSTTIDGRRFDLADYRGQWVLVNYFASWCVACRKEHPELIRFDADHDRKGDAQIISVVYSDKISAVKSFFGEMGGDWPVVRDDSGTTALRYGVSGVPETYIVDPFGTVRVKLIGGVTMAGLDQIMAELQGTAP
ncbi:MAG: TlpA family protein disulfide reductase [Actinobacteria bacterium]|nr:TlpA family protein disulfide reductase [Actinomycetota bacterium]